MDAQARIAELQEVIQDRDDQIHQLQIEVHGAVQAALAAQAANPAPQPAVPPRNPDGLNQVGVTESILKSLQTPQIIRDISSFNGNPVKLHSFIKSIDNLIPLLEGARGTPIYPVWMQAIRTKIVGDADTVLEIYGTSFDWEDIKNTLITHYSDKRDEISLTRDLFKLSQTTTVEEFYSRVSHSISLLVNLLNLNEENPEVKTAKNSFYQELGLKVYLAGLKEPLGPIIRAQSPKSLKEALRLCLEEGNYNYVKNPFKPVPQIPPKPNHQTTNLFQPPSRSIMYPPRQFQPPLRPFHPPPIAMQQPSRAFQPVPGFSNNFPRSFQQNPQNFQRPPPAYPQRNVFAQKQSIPLPKPTPMDVDPSIRTRQINYMNRPNFQIPEEIISEYPYLDYNYFYPENDFLYPDDLNSNTETCSNSSSQQPEMNNQEENIQTDDLNFRQQEADLAPT